MTRMKPSTELSSHDRILRAGKQFFALNGYENTSTVTIAREAGTSESQLMKHFGSKHGLLMAILERGWTNVGERLRALHSASPVDRLIAVLTSVTAVFEQDPEFKTLAAVEARRVRKEDNRIALTRGWQQYRELIDEILTDMRAEGQIRHDINIDALRSAIIGMAEGLWRDQVVASRSEMSVAYGFDDVHKIMEFLITGLVEPTMAHARAS
jgi:AcrR family transcriptional regulator